MLRNEAGISLVVQWMGIRPPMQGTQIQLLFQDDSTRQDQLSPRATATEAFVPTACALQQEKPLH